jgi:hypothetical protein
MKGATSLTVNSIGLISIQSSTLKVLETKSNNDVSAQFVQNVANY